MKTVPVASDEHFEAGRVRNGEIVIVRILGIRKVRTHHTETFEFIAGGFVFWLDVVLAVDDECADEEEAQHEADIVPIHF